VVITDQRLLAWSDDGLRRLALPRNTVQRVAVLPPIETPEGILVLHEGDEDELTEIGDAAWTFEFAAGLVGADNVALASAGPAVPSSTTQARDRSSDANRFDPWEGVDDPDAASACSKCGARFTVSYRLTCCDECGAHLVDRAGNRVDGRDQR
jgi:hypothetical protein